MKLSAARRHMAIPWTNSTKRRSRGTRRSWRTTIAIYLWSRWRACSLPASRSPLCWACSIACRFFFITFKTDLIIFIKKNTLKINSFDGRVVARLPFQPISWIQGLSHRNLPGEDYYECSFIFLYILCTMSVRQNIQKMLGFAPSRAAAKQGGGLFGTAPGQFK